MKLENLTPSKILVVEGRNEGLALTDSLREKEYPALITSVSDVAVASQALDQEEFDIIILDCEIDKLGGPDFFRQLLLTESEPRSIAVLPQPSVQEVQRLQAAGCSICVTRDGSWKRELAGHVVRLSRQKRAEAAEALARAKQVEINRYLTDKNRRLEDFSMTVAHDIRGPLGGIAMNLEYVMDTYGQELPGRCREMIDKALRASERLTGLVQEMYHYARLGSQASRMGPVSLDDLLNEVIADLREAYQARKIEFTISELPQVWGNKDLLRRVFLNLVSNAVKYNDKEEVRIEVISLGDQERMLGNYRVISVSDNGPGIPSAKTENIFAMYQRGQHAPDQTEGLGIGLAVVQRIVELHLGAIDVECKPGQGTSFVIALPAERVSTNNV